MTALLEVRNLNKRFGGLTAVNDLSFDVAKGNIVGLIGPNGAGKTTVFNLISGHFPPTSGEVHFKGQSVGSLLPHERVRRGMVRTFQSTTLYNESTALENVIRGCAGLRRLPFWRSMPGLGAAAAHEEDLRDRALRLLDFVDLGAMRDELACNLAYGHQRALGVAIGLATEPELMMLDEPVAGMNPGETAQMAKLIRRLNEGGMTILVVEHDMSFVMQLCRNIIVVNDGKKICEGEPETVRTNQAVITAYLGGADDAAA